MLWRKVFRDLNENKGAYLACAVIIIIALMVFTAFSMVSDNLTMSKEAFYSNQNFADGFIQVQALPFSEVENLKQIEGIADIQGRLVKDVRVLFPDRDENIYLRLVSLEPDRDNTINGVLLTQGIPLGSRGTNIWIDNTFFEANNLELNDKLEIVAGGKKRQLQIVGVGQSPEFIYALRTGADIYPSPETFGIGFVSLETMKSLFPKDKAFNDVVFTLKPEVDFDIVKDLLEYELKPFGLTAIFPRADQISHLLLMGELEQLETMSTALPILFLAIAGMILYIVLKRLIEQQRGQIGILKALGYTQGEIISHYLSYAVVIGLSGGILGAILGMFLSGPLTAMYQLFFNMPGLAGGFQIKYLIFGIMLSLGFSLIAGYQGCKRVLTLEPAEAMRPPAPVIGKKVLLEKIGFIWNMFTVQGMMAVRNISRNKGRSAFIFLGIMFCFAISSFTGSMNDLVQKMLYDQYEKVELYDVKVTLTRPLNEKNVLRELQAFPGVKNVEAMAEIPVTLSNKWHKQDTVLLGLPRNSQLYNILDKEYNKLDPPQNGLLLSERLADLLEADVGTRLTVDSPMLRETSDEHLEVVGIIPQYLGMNGYMELGSVQDFLRQGPLATAIMVNIDGEKIPALQEKYLESDVVADVDEKNQRLVKMQEMMETFGSMIYMFLVIGIIIGFAIIYSSSIITVSERSRELASMMVLGMTPAEVLSVITFEQWFLGIPAMAAGIPLSYALMASIAREVSTDVFTMPVIITFSSYLLATLVTALSIWIAQRAAARKISSLSLVEVLKSRE
ncbi:ABC transporter permease [Desulfitibacter alkalitolerans]|uniref:ABC transporter permease n=1 Tax=Desulfitibacter alkalitolerans TaxID=264641 RepID=UPI0006876F19|nr:FtsX-like permease family protein [Desulfitibacter alkalitolerans]